jgi:hypothetical protein
MAWDRLLEKKSAERLIAVDLMLQDVADGVGGLDAIPDERRRLRAARHRRPRPPRMAH